MAQDLAIEFVPPSELNPAPYNPRTIDDDALKRLAKLLDSHGFVDPLIARREDKLLIGGHQRLKANALRSKPDAKVPVVFLDGLTDAQAKALNVALNNPSAQGEWDRVKLAEVLQEIDTGELDVEALTAFSEAEIAELCHGLDEHAPEDFKEFGEDIDTEHKCPKCGYEWSGKSS